jgi:hypothetical protein
MIWTDKGLKEENKKLEDKLKVSNDKILELQKEKEGLTDRINTLINRGKKLEEIFVELQKVFDKHIEVK